MNQELTKAAQRLIEASEAAAKHFGYSRLGGCTLEDSNVRVELRNAADELRALTQRPAAQDTVVRVCPFKDAECGDRPASWCDMCPKHPAAQEVDEPKPFNRDDLERVLTEWNDTTGALPVRGSWYFEVLGMLQDAFDIGAAQQATPEPVGEPRNDQFDYMLSTLRYVLGAGQAAAGESARDHYKAIINTLASKAARSESDEVRFACEAVKRAAYPRPAAAPAPAPAVPEGFALVPVEPTEEQWGGLARDMMLAFDMNAKSPALLLSTLRNLGHDIPQWMLDEVKDEGSTHALSKGTRAVLVYRAMLAAAQAKGGV